MTSSYLTRPVRSIEQVRADRAKSERRDPMAPFASFRAEFAEIARGKLRQARAGSFGDATLERLADWASGFAA